MQALNYKCHYSDASTWCKYKSYEFHLFYVISIQSKHTYNTFTLNEFGPGNGLIHMDDIECTGDEERLFDCSFTQDHNCWHSEDASVNCSV